VQNKTIAIGHRVFSPWSELLQNRSVCAWLCTSLWHLCLYWSWHCQRR